MSGSGPENGLLDAFRERFGEEPTHLSRAPGRVNLIGEHTDYNLLPVFPIAIQREVRLALRPREDGVVTLHNRAPEFEEVVFEIHPGIEPGPDGHWGNYPRGVADELARRFAIWRGFDGVIQSDVPVASGLSSSSALLNAVGLALVHLNEVGAKDPLALADVFAEAERFTGTRGGGMDQAISLAGRAGCAARIDFSPLRMSFVPVPEDWRFVVADSGVRAEKSGPAQSVYNQRRAECEEALTLVCDHVGREDPTGRRPGSYPELLRHLGSAEAAMAAGRAALGGTLFKRFRHVVEEAERVGEAVDQLRAADPVELGHLMDASHASLRTDYLVSTVELDELVERAAEGGAYGARLTGAGLGGCVVALADRGSVGSVLEVLADGYYRPRGLADDLDARLFVAEPSEGASFGPLGRAAPEERPPEVEPDPPAPPDTPAPPGPPRAEGIDHLSTGFENF